MVDVAVPALGPMVTGTSVLAMVVQLVCTCLGIDADAQVVAGVGAEPVAEVLST
jgi:hypothetical protein